MTEGLSCQKQMMNNGGLIAFIAGEDWRMLVEMATSEKFDLAAWLQANREWSERVFGGGTRAEGVLKHIAKEIEEVRAAPHDLEEWVDIVFLAFDGMWRQGYSPEEIMAMMRTKQAKNFARKWPAPPPQDEPSFHVEGGE